MEKLRVLELFAGIGAVSKALTNIGVDIEIVDAVEIDKYAINSFNAIHNTNFEVQDICEWDKDIEVDLISHGSPCFLAGERVNTINGFKNIEDIKFGDTVKSHNGTYNKVIKTFKSFNDDIYNIRCSATHNINTTGNHPFYILRNKKRGWIQAKELTNKDYMCIPINKNQNDINNINTILPLDSIRFWYLIGRFIGDGWVTKRKDRNYNISGIKICCAKDELEDLQNKLCNIIHYCVVEDKSTYKLQFTNKELGEFCSEFGLGAKNKHIPQWVLDLKTEYLEYLLMGIIDSDGCYSQNKYKVTTISRDLVYNIAELILKVKKVPYHIYKTIRPNKYKIENRIVNQNNTYQITWSSIYNENINFIDDDYLYSRIRKIENINKKEPVYNIEVENTHSYCVNNIATHNCQDFSIAGKQAGADEGSETRSSLMYETIRIVGKLRPKYVLWENVKNLLSKKHIHNFNNYIAKLEELGYNSYYQVLNAKDYGVPQNRERVYTISIRKDIDKGYMFPEKETLNLRLKDLLDDVVDEKYYLSDIKINKITNSNFKQEKKRIQEKEYCDTILARDWKDPKCVQVGNLRGGRWDKMIESCRRVYSDKGISPTVNTYQGGNTEAKVLVENDIDNPLKGKSDYGWHFEQNVYSEGSKCCRSVKAGGGSGNIPKIITYDVTQTVKVRKYPVDTEKLKETLRSAKIDTDITNSRIAFELDVPITKVEHWFRKDECFAIPDPEIWYALKSLLKIETDEFDKSIMEFEERDGVYDKSNRVYDQEGLAPTLTQQQEKVVERTPLKFLNRNQKNIEGDYAFCVDSCNTGGIKETTSDNIRIRKLTPRECWRLMSFTDEDFEKAEKVNSNTQLYKQAGNSIVVKVLEKIFLNLFGDYNG